MKRVVILSADRSSFNEGDLAKLEAFVRLEQDVGIIGVGFVSIDVQHRDKIPASFFEKSDIRLLLHNSSDDVAARIYDVLNKDPRKGAVVHFCYSDQVDAVESGLSRRGYLVECIPLRHWQYQSA
ncbi:MAG: hypothetical protein AABY16_00045 [Nanoarchaeota archaeon]